VSGHRAGLFYFSFAALSSLEINPQTPRRAEDTPQSEAG
jgi:hypothetical protein